jgi:hypothetical protein
MLSLLLVGCIEYEPGTPFLEGSVAVTAGDFDDVQTPFDRMVVNSEAYEGLIASATWDDDYEAANHALKVEDLIGPGNDIARHGLVVFASGTRGFGNRSYAGLEADDRFLVDPDARARVQARVATQGTVMLTDWTYDLAEQIWPDSVDYAGDDDVFDAAQIGPLGDITARVTDDRLADALGTDVIVLRYDFSNWAVIEDVDADATVWLRGDIGELSNVPLLVSFRPEGADGGTVVVATFHLDAQTPDVTDEVLRTVVGL